jgi:hypothetical protein
LKIEKKIYSGTFVNNKYEYGKLYNSSEEIIYEGNIKE